MERKKIQQLIDDGYHVIRNGQPIKVAGDIWEFLDTLDEEEPNTYVLSELLKLSDDELSQL